MPQGYPRAGGTVLFLGRYDEPRKGMEVLLGALPELVRRHRDLEILIVGRGDEERLHREAGPLAKHLRFLGQVSDEEKASAIRSADVYCAPNLGGESFGIILIEAMAAGTAVVASELDAFRRVLRDGAAGVLVPVGDSAGLAAAIDSLLTDDARREALVQTATQVVGEYDWPVVAEQILRVYETVTVGDVRVRAAG
jgi:phosphatidylinositol alpha-mannosyltransferase